MTYSFTKQVSIAPLVVFRMLFGSIMLFGVLRFAYMGWIDEMYVYPEYHFTWPGFEWVQPLGRTGIYVLFVIMGWSALCIAFGLFYRIHAVLFFLSFTYVELIDKTWYLNHYYLITLISFLLCLLPAHKNFSLDVRWRITKPVDNIPAWMIDAIKLQLGMVYFFAGIAKIQSEWLLNAQPMKLWLSEFGNAPLVGKLLVQNTTAYVFSWVGMLFDVSIPFILLNNRLRPYGYVLVVVFHIATWLLFPIGMFPFIMIGFTLIFFSETVHQQVINTLKHVFNVKNTNESNEVGFGNFLRQRLLGKLLIIYFLIQLWLPFRYLLFTGNVLWTERGFRFSWRVMLIDKRGEAVFHLRNTKTGYSKTVYPLEYLTPYQQYMMCTQPDMIVQFAKFLKKKEKNNVRVTADVFIEFNGREKIRYINPELDLAKVNNFEEIMLSLGSYMAK